MVKAEINIKNFNIKQVAARMVHKGLNEAELARRMKVSSNCVNTWMNCKRKPAAKRIPKLAKVLGVNLAYLFVPDNSHAG